VKAGVNTLFLIPGEVGGSEMYLGDTLAHAFGGALKSSGCCSPIARTTIVSSAFRIPFQRGFPGGQRPGAEPGRRILREQLELAVESPARRRGRPVVRRLHGAATRVLPAGRVVLDMQYREFPEDWRRRRSGCRGSYSARRQALFL